MRRWITPARVGVLVLSLAVIVPAATTATAGTTQLYAKGVPICKTPANLLTAHKATCFAMRRVLVKAGTPGARPYFKLDTANPAVTVGPAGGLTPSDLTGAYHLSGTGSGQTVALVDAYNDPNINADLQTFDSHYGLSTCSTGNGCLKVVGQTGTSSLPANDTTGWSGEETLDVEAVRAVCSACKIVLVEANSSSDTNLAAAVNTAANTIHATEISNSYGGPESGGASDASAYNHPGIVITASSGDDGYYDFDFLGGNGTISQPNTPAAYPTVVAVGGTSLYLGSTATRSSETVWNDNGANDIFEQAFGGALGAEGGGCSLVYAAKGWQSNKTGYSAAACSGKRLVSDVSLVADPLTGFDIYDSYSCGGGCSTGWMTIGGTSLSAPLAAAAYALSGGAHGVPYPAVTLYGHPTSVYDVTAGGNGFCGGMGAAQCSLAALGDPTGNPNLAGAGVLDCAWNSAGVVVTAGERACDAAPGFDGPTGVGTPNSQTLFAKTGPSFTISGGSTATHGVAHSWSATSVTDPFPGGSVGSTGWTWNWGDGSTTSSTSATPAAHTYASAGTYTITATAKDNYGVAIAKTLVVTVS